MHTCIRAYVHTCIHGIHGIHGIHAYMLSFVAVRVSCTQGVRAASGKMDGWGCMHVWMDGCMNISMYVCMYVFMYTHTHTQTHTNTHTHTKQALRKLAYMSHTHKSGNLREALSVKGAAIDHGISGRGTVARGSAWSRCMRARAGESRFASAPHSSVAAARRQHVPVVLDDRNAATACSWDRHRVLSVQRQQVPVLHVVERHDRVFKNMISQKKIAENHCSRVFVSASGSCPRGFQSAPARSCSQRLGNPFLKTLSPVGGHIFKDSSNMMSALEPFDTPI